MTSYDVEYLGDLRVLVVDINQLKRLDVNSRKRGRQGDETRGIAQSCKERKEHVRDRRNARPTHRKRKTSGQANERFTFPKRRPTVGGEVCQSWMKIAGACLRESHQAAPSHS